MFILNLFTSVHGQVIETYIGDVRVALAATVAQEGEEGEKAAFVALSLVAATLEIIVDRKAWKDFDDKH
jgi:hypothetical protein